MIFDEKKMKSIKVKNDFESLAGVLQFELFCRQQKNKGYSLRAFAKSLSIPPSQLSLILKYKKGLSLKRAQLVGESLGYSKSKLKWFTLIVEKDFSRSHLRKIQAKKELKSYVNGVLSKSLYEQPLFNVSWYHFAIKRMILLKDFKLDAEWISKKIGLSKTVIQVALDDLIKNKLLKVNKNKITSSGNISLFAQGEDKVKFRKRFLAEVSEEIEKRVEKDYDVKVHDGNHFFTINSEQIKNLEKMINHFEDQVDDLTYKKRNHDQLCYLSVQLVKMTKDTDS